MKKKNIKVIKKIVFVIILWVAVFGVLPMFDLMMSRPGAEAGVANLNGGNYEADAIAITAHIPSAVYSALIFILGFFTYVMFKMEINTIMKKIRFNSIAVLLFAASALFMTGCRKQYDTPTFQEIRSYETAFMIQAEGNTENQDMFASADILQKSMVAAKRVQIPHKWVQTGRRSWQGKWIDSVLFLVVNRTPVTRVWDADTTKGTSSKNQALTAESLDSLFVATGFTLTAFIEPANASKFLFKYQGGSLSAVIDSQVKNSVQTVFTEECAKYDLMELPAKKGDIMKAIRDKVIPFYAAWGITLSTDMGLVGGLKYTDAIQLEIDGVFTAEKAKEKAVADKLAQVEINLKLKGMAENDAEIVKIAADAEAYGVSKKAEAYKAAGPLYAQIEAINKWDGILSKVAGGQTMNMLNLGDVTK